MTPHITRTTQCPARAEQDAAQRYLPLSVWLAAADSETVPACRGGCCVPVSGPLARHLVTACTRLGDTVIHLDAADHQVVSVAVSMGCRATATFADPGLARVVWQALTRIHPLHDLEVADLCVPRPESIHPEPENLLGTAALVVVQQICSPLDSSGGPAHHHDEHEGTAQVDVVRAAALLKPGGHLAVVTGLHRAEDEVADPAPEIIARAQRAGLVYLQHIVALRALSWGEEIQDAPAPGASAVVLPECVGLPVSARVHSDVLIFTKPADSELDGADELIDGTTTQSRADRR